MTPETSVDAELKRFGNVRRPFAGHGAGDAGTGAAATDAGSGAPVGDSIIASPGSALRFLASVLRAKAVAEVGTGSGASTLWLLRGMVPDGMVTSIDRDPEAQRGAREALSEAGVAASRVRLITGMAADVLPRLAEGAYDLVFVDADRGGYPNYLELGVRLLRPGGAIVFTGAERPGRDEESVAMRALTRLVSQDENLVPVALPVGDGLFAISRP